MSIRDDFFRNEHGSVLVEFAFALPILIIIITGIIELTGYIQFREKMDSTAIQILDVVSQQPAASSVSLANAVSAKDQMMLSFVNTNSSIVISMVERPKNPINPALPCKAVVGWQYGGGSRIGGKGMAVAASIQQLVPNPEDHVMVIEMQATYRPLLDTGFTREMINGATGALYTRSYAHVRTTSFRVDPTTGFFINSPCL